jgi:hypothetical protein
MPLPRINRFLSRHWLRRAQRAVEHLLLGSRYSCNGAAESEMKIYLLIMLIGILLTAVHFTSAPERQSETLPQ